MVLICLTGALDRSRLSVTIRNSTCQVDSRFVSNHDFHEVCYCIEVLCFDRFSWVITESLPNTAALH